MHVFAAAAAQLNLAIPVARLPETLAIKTFGQHTLPLAVADGVQAKLQVRVVRR